MLPDIPGMTSADEASVPIAKSNIYPPKLSENRSTSAAVGINESDTATSNGIRNANAFATVGREVILSVTENIPPRASPTKRDTVGNGNAESAQPRG